MSQKLIDQLTPDLKAGRIEGVLATTYELDSTFIDEDFLPTVLGLSTTSSHRHSSRIALQRGLAELAAASFLMDARCYRGGRPSLRTEIVARVGDAGALLHAKVTLLVQPDALRLLIGSANLTDNGYRRNREVACVLAVGRKDALRTGPIVAGALRLMPDVLQRWWTPSAQAVWELARSRLAEWGVDVDSPAVAATDDERFVWSDRERTLWQRVVDAWPAGEAIEKIHIVSPFWSHDDGSGPVCRLLQELGQRGSIADAALTLCTPAEAFAGGASRPALPVSYGTLDFARFGVRAAACAVVGAVDVNEAGVDDLRAERKLHAKVLLIEGKKTAVAYAGSANFTASGWGFRPQANIEAGLLFVRRGKSRADLQGLLPPLHSERVALDGAATQKLAVVVDEAPAPVWPSFLQELRLLPAPGADGRLLLRARVDGVAGDWRVTCRDEATPVLEGREGPDVQTALTEAVLTRLLIDREARVFWWAGPPEGAVFPLNVDAEARDALPLTPGSGMPGEDALLAYYQGRLTFEQLFPPTGLDLEDGDDDEKGAAVEGNASEVDTSGIQSYQVRSFIEALPGLERELQVAKTATALRFALRGPVSPLALARAVAARVQAGTRTTTAGAFQLVELLAVLDRLRSVAADDDARATVDDAGDELGVVLADVIAAEPGGMGPAFQRYQRRIRPGVR